MSTPQDFKTTFKYNLTCIFLSLRAKLKKKTLCPQTPCTSIILVFMEYLENSWGFFVKRSLNAPTGVDRRNQKEKKKSWLNSVFQNTTKFRIWSRNLIQFSVLIIKMSTSQDFKTTFKYNLTCIFLSLRTKLKNTLPSDTL